MCFILELEPSQVSSLVSLNPEIASAFLSKLIIEFHGKEFIDALAKSDDLNVQMLDDDVVVNGTSVRQISHMNAVWQTQVELYFSLLITPTGEPVTETFDEIADEFPEEMIREIVKKIDEAIRPNYKDTKKN